MSYQIRRERPTRKTAHDFLRRGSFATDPGIHTLRNKEREEEIKRVGDSLQAIVKQQFPRTQNLEYAVLKSHLIVEFALIQWIRCFAATFVEAEDLRFSFSQKLEIAYLMGFGANDPTLLPTVEILNRVRNQVAHRFELDRRAVDEMLRINHEDPEEFSPKNDRERVRLLRVLCTYICARTGGEIEGTYYFIASS